MPFIDYDPALGRDAGHKEYARGKLLKAGSAAIEGLHFEYSVVKSRDFKMTASSMPANYALPSETIRTTRLDLPFQHGDKVMLQDGRTMTVGDLEYAHDDKRAFTHGDGRTAWIITLQGGGR